MKPWVWFPAPCGSGVVQTYNQTWDVEVGRWRVQGHLHARFNTSLSCVMLQKFLRTPRFSLILPLGPVLHSISYVNLDNKSLKSCWEDELVTQLKRLASLSWASAQLWGSVFVMGSCLLFLECVCMYVLCAPICGSVHTRVPGRRCQVSCSVTLHLIPLNFRHIQPSPELWGFELRCSCLNAKHSYPLSLLASPWALVTNPVDCGV